ncbi:MAG: hypothetical protein B6U78_02760 [Candidatus Aenigmarchaeota archaeon ex4484_224]|nr:MAG: hypothetical protein B6U78_02760 [Candidatus Aenigmarchaeota archaeon ex4484_224]
MKEETKKEEKKKVDVEIIKDYMSTWETAIFFKMEHLKKLIRDKDWDTASYVASSITRDLSKLRALELILPPEEE